jgi:hypothetical protein
MSKQVTVNLGGREYVISALPIKQSKAWREQLAVPFGTLASALTSANTVEVNQFADIASLVRSMSGVLLGSVDMLLELMFSYSPDLESDREWIEENAFDEEALAAFAEVLKLAFPFATLLDVVTGRTANKTSSNSASRNGASGLPTSGPKKKTSTTSPTPT